MRNAASQAIARRVLREFHARAHGWVLYASLRDEVSMKPLFDAIRADGGLPLFPRIRDTSLEFVPVRNWGELGMGARGVPRAAWGQSGRHLSPDDVVVLPGLAFDRYGFRLGRGGGYYDRRFGTAQSAPLLIGVGYFFQLQEHVPHDARDRRVDAIVTERGIVWPGRRR